jgi:Ni,Fe-hydrogenase III large subunit
MIHESIGIQGLSQFISMKMKDGYGIGCMYITEPSKTLPRCMETILISQDDIIRATSELHDPSYPSIASTIPSAAIYEREMYEMNNIIPLRHPDLRPLRLRMKGKHLLSKDGEKEGEPCPIPKNGISGEGIFEIPVGPIHAGVIEPGHFRFSVAGEPVLMLRTYMGYVHRGIEKMMETPLEKDHLRLMERVSGDSGIANSLAYLQIMEYGNEIPIRAKYIRTILSELERIYYHLSGISGMSLDTALSVPAAKGAMLKERILRLNQRIAGNRFLRNMLKIGGVARDLNENDLMEIEKEVMRLRFDVTDLTDMMINSASFMDRAETTGILTTEDAVRFRTVGPAARASNVDNDVRKQHPYEAYDMVGMKVPLYTTGDVYARLKVKRDELIESISIVTQCINYMEKGPICVDIRTEDGFRMGMVESSRGELIHCANITDGKIWRYKIRDPSFTNWIALENAILGNVVPDFPLTNKSFDLSYSGNDL